jgi:hypothetical protein
MNIMIGLKQINNVFIFLFILMKKLSVFLTAVILTTFLTACTKTNVEPANDSTLDKYESIRFNPDNYESKTLELD